MPFTTQGETQTTIASMSKFGFISIVTSSSAFYVKEQIVYHTIDTSQGGSDNNDIVIVTDGDLVENGGGGGNILTPYQIMGTVFSLAGTALADEIVKAYNKTTKELITARTDDDGFYIIECANFPSGFSNGDVIELTAGVADRAYKATLRAVHTGEEGFTIGFQMCADGFTWEDVTVDSEHTFAESGADLRWRAVGVKEGGVYLTEVRIEYDTVL